MDKAIEKIEWLQDVFVTRKEEQHFDVDVTIKNAFAEALASLQANKAEMEKLRPAKILKACPADCKQQEHCIVCCRMYHDQYKIQLEELDK